MGRGINRERRRGQGDEGSRMPGGVKGRGRGEGEEVGLGAAAARGRGRTGKGQGRGRERWLVRGSGRPLAACRLLYGGC